MSGTGGMIMRRIRSRGRGSVWTPKAFLDLGSRAAVDQALKRLVDGGSLQRVARGVYAYPEVSPRLGPLTPPPDEVARAVAVGTGSRLQVSGARAANALGLSTQVPAKSVYLTDGPSRTVRVGRQTVQLRTAPAWQLRGAGTRAGLALQALRYLGPHGVDDAVVRRLGTQLGARDRKVLLGGARQGPDWMRAAAERVARAA